MASNQPRIGLLGGGQLGRMLLESANRLNLQVNVLDAENAPAKQISAHAGHVKGSFADEASIQELAKISDILTIEIEHVDTFVLERVSIPIQPSWKTIRTIQDKFAQKEHLTAANIGVASYRDVPESTAQCLTSIAAELNYPFMLKAKTQAYDGRGNYPVRSDADISPAIKALGDRPLYAEKWAHFTKELAVMVVKTSSGVLSYPTVETIHEDSICKLVYAPARNISPTVNTRAQQLARDAVAAFEGKGVFGVEMFLVDDDKLLVNEIAPRPHNSGHYTIEACSLSQYDSHLRAILDEPIPAASLRQKTPAVMLNILGGGTTDAHLKLAELAKSVPGASIHLYGKGDARPGRKMGHVTVTATTMREAEINIRPLIQAADKVRSSRKDVQPLSSTATTGYAPQSAPLVGIVTGSISDQSVLEPCYQTLQKLGVSFSKNIKSAHRTPDEMRSYGQSAAGRGFKVIIAAAGGAAHLPGMVSSYTQLPVIGLPIKPSVGDGTDSVLSILNMPRGKPVATVSVNNAVNAALLAGKILGSFDDRVQAKVRDYEERAADESMENDRKLEEIWDPETA